MTDREVHLTRNWTLGSQDSISELLQDAEVKSWTGTVSVSELSIDLTEATVEGAAKKKLAQNLPRYISVFSYNNEESGRHDKVHHEIVLKPECELVKQPP